MHVRRISYRNGAGLTALCAAIAVAALPINTSHAETPAATPRATSAPSLDNAVRTMNRAIAEGRRIEDASERSETSQLFANPDGSWTAEISPGPVRAQDDVTGEWAPIDTTLVKADGGYAPKLALGNLVVSDGGDTTFAKMGVDDSQHRERAVRWDWGKSLPAPVIAQNTATYRDVSANADLVVTATPSGFRHDLVLRERPTEPVVVDIPVSVTGARVADADAGTLDVVDASGKKLVASSPAVMYDARSTAAGNPENAVAVNTDVKMLKPDAGVVRLRPDNDFLQDPATTYPVTIDPTYTSYVANDTFVGSGDPYSYYPWNETLQVGSDNGGNNIYRSYLQFSNGPWFGAEVSSATLRMRNFKSLTCSGSTVNVSRVTAAYDNGTMQWRNRAPATSTGQAGSSQAYGHSGCSTPTDMTWNVTSIVRAWATPDATQRQPNYGLRVAAANETISSGYREFRSDNYDTNESAWPRLSVNFNRYPLTPDTLTIDDEVEMDAVYADTFDVAARLQDADSELLSGTFSLVDVANPGVTVWTETVSQTTANSVVAATVPPATLVKGQSYRLSVKSKDAAGLFSPVLTDQFVYFDVIENTESATTVESTEPITISGVLRKNGAAVGNAAVLVQVRPKAQYVEDLADEATVPMWRLGNVPTDAQGNFELTFDPTDLPEAFESDTGAFNLELDGSDGADTLTYDLPVDGVPEAPVAQAAVVQGQSLQNSSVPTSSTTETVSMDLGTGAASSEDDPTATWQTCDEFPCSEGGVVVEPGSEVPASPPVDGRDEENIVPETAATAADRDTSVEDANAVAAALLAQQSGNAALSSARVTSNSLSAAAVPMAGGCARQATNEYKKNTYERFGSIYNWGGAKADWTQTTSSEHQVGIAVNSGGGWRSAGSLALGNSKNKATGNTAHDVVNKNAYNYVTYRKIRIVCGGDAKATKWEPTSVSAFFVAMTKSVKQTWTNSSCVTYSNNTLTKDSGRAYTKATGVDLIGVMQLSAQSGNNRATRVAYDINKETRVCPSTNAGINSAPAIRLFKP